MAQDTEDLKEMTETSDAADVQADLAETRMYELGFHLDGELPQEEAKKAYESLKALIAKDGTVVSEGTPAKIQLAYTISRMDTTGRRDFNTAYFAWVAYEANGAAHNAITEAAKADKRIVRFIDLRTSKEAAQHSAEMHEFYQKMPAVDEASAAEDSADAELDAALKEVGAAV